MTEQERMAQILERNQWVIEHQTEGLSHADSLLQLPFRSNCLNWILGHIVAYRDRMLRLLEEPLVLTDSEIEIYTRGSVPLTAGSDAFDLAKLVEASSEAEKRLLGAFDGVTEDKLGGIYDEERGTTIRARLEFLLWHETYHLGQLEVMRQRAGMDDAVI